MNSEAKLNSKKLFWFGGLAGFLAGFTISLSLLIITDHLNSSWWSLLLLTSYLVILLVIEFLVFKKLIDGQLAISKSEMEHAQRMAMEEKQDARRDKELQAKSKLDEYDKINGIVKSLVELYKTKENKAEGFSEEHKKTLEEHLKTPIQLISDIKKIIKGE